MVGVTIKNSDGHVVDTVIQPLGLRSFSVDPDKGLILNGKPYAAHGVNTHQEVADKGWAGSNADYDLNYKLVRELGATCVAAWRTTSTTTTSTHSATRWALSSGRQIPLVDRFGKSPALRGQHEAAASRVDQAELQPPVDFCSGDCGTNSPPSRTMRIGRWCAELNSALATS